MEREARQMCQFQKIAVKGVPAQQAENTWEVCKVVTVGVQKGVEVHIQKIFGDSYQLALSGDCHQILT